MIEFSITEWIDRPVEDVFVYYMKPENRVEWDDNVVSAKYLSEGPVQKGSVFEVEITVGQRNLSTHREITAYHPPHRMCYEMYAGFVELESCQTFEPVNGGTRFTIHVQMRPKGLLRLIGRWLKRQQQAHIAEGARRLKAVLEAKTPQHS